MVITACYEIFTASLYYSANAGSTSAQLFFVDD